jgi:plasmid replication initiation protein
MEQIKKSLVIYKNDFNNLSLKGFNAVEIDLLLSIMSQLREKGTDLVVLSFSDLRGLSRYEKNTANEPLIADLKSTYDKLLDLKFEFAADQKYIRFVFFTHYVIDEKEKTVSVSVNPEFKFLINDLSGNFTRLELEELTSLSSSYAKNMYRLLKQYRATGFATYAIEDFRRLLDIPESYSMGNITQKVLKPIESELKPYFHRLKIDKVKGTGKDSRKIVRLNFSFWNDDSIKKGFRVFRRSDGTYYERYIADFTPEEIKKAYPDSPKDNIIH